MQRVNLHGHEVAFRMTGSGSVVILIHGMAGSSTTWQHILPTLAERYTVMAPDLIGHGSSARRRGDHSLSAHASMVRDLMEALGVERATLVGQSFGGGVAMQFAYLFPERCERLVLASSGGLGAEVHPLLRVLSLPGAEALLALACRSQLHKLAGTLAKRLNRSGMNRCRALEEIGRSYASLTDAASRRAFFDTLRGVVDGAGQRVSARDRLYLICAMPTLILWGRQDPIIPMAHALATHAAIPHSRLEIFDDAGHFLHCEQPDRFVAVLDDFIATTAPLPLSNQRFRQLLAGASGEPRRKPSPLPRILAFRP